MATKRVLVGSAVRSTLFAAAILALASLPGTADAERQAFLVGGGSAAESGEPAARARIDWQVETIDEATKPPSLALDADGDALVAYARDGTLRLATRASGLWSNEAVLVDGEEIDHVGAVDLRLGQPDQPWIAVGHRNTVSLLRREAGAWHMEDLVMTPGAEVWAIRLRLDEAGQPLVLAQLSLTMRGGPVERYSKVLVAARRDGRWQVTALYDDHREPWPRPFVEADFMPAVDGRLLVSISVGGVLHHGELDGVRYAHSSLGIIERARKPVLAAFADGQIQGCYAQGDQWMDHRPGSLICARLESDDWTVSEEPADRLPRWRDFGDRLALAIDAAGLPHVAYAAYDFDARLLRLRYASPDDDGWVLSPLPDGHWMDSPSLALTEVGIPYLAFIEEEMLRFAHPVPPATPTATATATATVSPQPSATSTATASATEVPIPPTAEPSPTANAYAAGRRLLLPWLSR